MAHISINSRVINNVKSDDLFTLLNNMIEAELEKNIENVDTDFVDECVDALLALEQEENNFAVLVPLMSSDKFLKKLTNNNHKAFKSLNAFARGAIVAAIIAGGTFSANAMVEAITDVNIIETIAQKIEYRISTVKGIEEIHGEDEEEPTTKPRPTGIEEIAGEDDDDDETTTTTLPSTTKPRTTGIEEIAGDDDDDDETTTTTMPSTTRPVYTTTKPSTTKRQIKPTTEAADIVPVITRPSHCDEPTTEAAPVYVGLYASFDNFKGDYIYNEEIDYENIVLKKIYSDGSQEDLSIYDCSYTNKIDMTITQDVTIRIIYKNTLVTVDITIRPDEETRGSEIGSNDEFDYFLTKKGAYITKYKGNEAVLDLSQMGGKVVYAIADDVFRDSDIEEVYAPNVKKVFKNAFRGCASLESCYIPEAEYIDSYAFEGCSKLENAVFSDNLDYFGEGVYMNSGITSVKMPKGITAIPDMLCSNCKSLEEVYLTTGTAAVGELAFSDCEALLNVYNTEALEEVGDYAFSGDTLVNFSSFPSGIKAVGVSAFEHCQSLEIGSIPQTINSIGRDAFAYCFGINEITIPSGISTVPYGAFRGTNAATLTISEGVKVIEPYAFMGIKARTLVLPSTLEVLGDYAINSMMLQEIRFGNGITKMGSNVVYPNRRLKVYVYEDSLPHKYAVANGISYVLY